ncbi:hypothetical protein ACET3Z_028836 [Daucus carota]
MADEVKCVRAYIGEDFVREIGAVDEDDEFAYDIIGGNALGGGFSEKRLNVPELGDLFQENQEGEYGEEIKDVMCFDTVWPITCSTKFLTQVNSCIAVWMNLVLWSQCGCLPLKKLEDKTFGTTAMCVASQLE